MAREKFIDPVGSDEYEAGERGKARVAFFGNQPILRTKSMVFIENTGTPPTSDHPNKINSGSPKYYDDHA
jgi:hypothetical protein